MIFHVHVGNVNSVGFVGGCTPHRSHILRGCIGTISALARLRFHACILLLGRGLTKRSTCWQSRTFVPANAECCRARNASIHPLRIDPSELGQLMLDGGSGVRLSSPAQTTNPSTVVDLAIGM